jgi:hypothetical protein
MPVFAQHGGGHAGGAGSAGRETKGGTSASVHGTSAGAETKQLNNFFSNTSSKLYTKISGLLPAGTTMKDLQAMGFKNLGQLISTVHVYNNLGLAAKTPPVPFADFAKAVTTKSLGSAIKQFDPTANSSAEVKKGNKQASDDMKGSG